MSRYFKFYNKLSSSLSSVFVILFHTIFLLIKHLAFAILRTKNARSYYYNIPCNVSCVGRIISIMVDET